MANQPIHVFPYQDSDYMRHARLYVMFLVQARQDPSTVVTDSLLITLDRCIAFKNKPTAILQQQRSLGSTCWTVDSQQVNWDC